MVIAIVILSLAIIGMFIFGFYLGHLHYHRAIMPYKLTEFIFDTLFNVDSHSQKQIITRLEHIGVKSEDLINEYKRYENNNEQQTNNTTKNEKESQ